jgi:phosphatidylserine decarboxylase
MDPFVIVSFGKKTFRTRAIRHSLNPVFNERLIFQILSPEKNYTISFNVYDRDRVTSNDFVAQAFLPVTELLATAPTPDPETGLFKLPEPWKEPRDVAKTTRPKFSRIMSRSNSSQNLAAKKSNGNGNHGATTPGGSSVVSGAPMVETPPPMELTRTLSSGLLSSEAGTLSRYQTEFS